MKKLLILAVAAMLTVAAQAQDFEKYFNNQTLRIDYTFSGNVQRQDIYVDKLNKMPGWYGKKKHLADVPVEGNGQIIVKDHSTQLVIYRNSFSTLFQEWLSYDEAKKEKKSFENVFLVPFPKQTVDITVNLYNNRRQVMTTLTHQVNPDDILIRRLGDKLRAPFITLQEAADTNRCIHIAYVAEGYRQEEMGTFINDAKLAMEALFSHEPYKQMKDRFNLIAVMSTPYEHIIVLVNTEKYGGGGILNSYNLSMAHHPKFRPVVVHEFGHSFAGLGDEYAYENEAIPMYPSDVEPWEPNLTTLKNFKGKWENMIDKNTPIPTPATKEYANKVGVYEGAGYSLNGVYRGMQDCRMRTNEYPEFCPICRQALEKLIKFYTE